MIERVFGESGLDKLWCEVLAANEAVWKLHQSFGFEIEARLRRHVIKGGEPQEVLGLGLLKEDWSKVRATQRERLAAKGYIFLLPTRPDGRAGRRGTTTEIGRRPGSLWWRRPARRLQCLPPPPRPLRGAVPLPHARLVSRVGRRN